MVLQYTASHLHGPKIYWTQMMLWNDMASMHSNIYKYRTGFISRECVDQLFWEKIERKLNMIRLCTFLWICAFNYCFQIQSLKLGNVDAPGLTNRAFRIANRVIKDGKVTVLRFSADSFYPLIARSLQTQLSRAGALYLLNKYRGNRCRPWATVSLYALCCSNPNGFCKLLSVRSNDVCKIILIQLQAKQEPTMELQLREDKLMQLKWILMLTGGQYLFFELCRTAQKL